MAKKKWKKRIAFWEEHKGTIIDKCAKEQIKQTERRYKKHRAKSKAGITNK